MSLNNAETYRKMLAYLVNRGFDVSDHTNAKVASISHASLSELDRVDLTHYEVILEATMAVANEYMDKTAMAQELIEVKQHLGHPIPADVQALTELEGNKPIDNSEDVDAPSEEFPEGTLECERCGDPVPPGEGSRRGPAGNQTTLCSPCTDSVYRR